MDHSPFLFEPSDIQDPWSPGPFSIPQLCPPTPIQFPVTHTWARYLFLNMSFNALGPLLMLFPLSEVPFPSVKTSCPTFWTLILTMQPSSSRVKLIPVIPNCPVLTSPSLTASRLSSRETLLLHSQSIQIGWSWQSHSVGDQPWDFFGRNDAKAETPVSTLATSCEELTHWKRLWCWQGLGAGEGDDRGWDGWMASLTRRTWVWVNSGSWWWTGRPGVLRFMDSQRVRHDRATNLIRSDLTVSHCLLKGWA